jgi:hypothetical protein
VTFSVAIFEGLKFIIEELNKGHFRVGCIKKAMIKKKQND